MDDLPVFLILNRSGALPEDGWYHVAPEGEYKHPTAGMQVLDEKSLNAMVASFQADKERLGDHFPGALVDFDHFSTDTDQSSEAAGWIQDLQARLNQADPKENGLWAKIDWTDIGEPAVKGKRFRLVSPTWNPRDCEKLEGKRIRPLRLESLALTNNPNIKGMKPLTNREPDVKEPIMADETIETLTTRRAATIKNYGTSEGAKKGWLTRRGAAGAAPRRMATRADVKAAAQKPSLKDAKDKETKAIRAYDDAQRNPSDRAAIVSAKQKWDAAHAEVLKAGGRERRAATKADMKQAVEKKVAQAEVEKPNRQAATKADISAAQIKATPMTRDEAQAHVTDLAHEFTKDRQGKFHEKLEGLGPEKRKGIVKALGLKTDPRKPFKAAVPTMEKHGAAVTEAAHKLYQHALL